MRCTTQITNALVFPEPKCCTAGFRQKVVSVDKVLMCVNCVYLSSANTNFVLSSRLQHLPKDFCFSKHPESGAFLKR